MWKNRRTFGYFEENDYKSVVFTIQPFAVAMLWSQVAVPGLSLIRIVLVCPADAELLCNVPNKLFKAVAVNKLFWQLKVVNLVILLTSNSVN